MTIHREGYPTLLLMGAILIGFNIGLSLALPIASLAVGMPISGLVFGFFLQFFRNPRRTIPDCPHGVIAPADGTIVAIERVLETEYFQAERLKLSIYMSALNVHLNRVPVTGSVLYTQYHPGKYLVAFHPKASELNERSTIVLQNEQGQTILVRQIAGILARRIVTYLQPQQSVRAGDELGFIKFGSRCDVFLPLDAHIQVQLEQKIIGGETVLALLPEPK
jgi:phosphatidylserine decarboxylase